MEIQYRFAKTPKAWGVLAQPDLVGRFAHALLLMANGRRSEKELSALLGDDVCVLAESLQRQGYLQKVEPACFGDGEGEAGKAGNG